MLVGRLTKDSADVRRAVVDFITLNWLDLNETIASINTPVIVVEQQQVLNFPQPPVFPLPAPVDTTPLTLVSSIILSGNQKVQLLLGVGTPGLTYKVTFVATGSSSGRQKQIDILVTIRQPI
jgi:hypothetical protein